MFAFVILFAAVATTAFGAAAIDSGKYDFPSPIQTQTSYGIDYDRFLGEGSQLPDTLKHALQTYKNVETLPSCNKVATSTLLHSCASIDSTASGDEASSSQTSGPIMEGVRSIYATRLAICELTEVKASIPAACSAFVLTESNTRKRGFLGRLMPEGPSKPSVTYPVYEAATEQDLALCRTALAKTPQSWTSYSNSKQNAATLCHAVRSEIEKDEQLHLFKILTETTVDVDTSLRVAVQRGRETADAFHQLSTHIRQFSLDIAENESTQIRIRDMWLKAMGEWKSGVKDLEQGIARIQDQVQQADTKISQAGEHATSTISQIVSLVNDQAKPITEQLATMSSKGDSLKNNLLFVNELLQQNLLQSLYAVAGNLDTMASDTTELQLATSKNAPAVARLVEDTVALAQYMQDMTNQAASVEHAFKNMYTLVEDASVTVAQMQHDAVIANDNMQEFLGSFDGLRVVLSSLRQLPTILCYIFVAGLASWVASGIPGVQTLVLGCCSFMHRCSTQYAIPILVILLTTVYVMFYETPNKLALRFKEGQITTFELLYVVLIFGSLLVALVTTALNRRSGVAAHHSAVEALMPPSEKKHGFWFNNPKAYAGRGKWTV